MTPDDSVVITGIARTPMGGFQGELAGLAAPELGAAAIRAAVERAGLTPDQVDQALMGCVLTAGQGQAPARQAALGAGLPLATGCTTVNKMCGSGMATVMLAHDMLKAGSASVVVAGGMESMSNAPYLMEKARAGLRMGHGRVLDHMFLDGLEDAYDRGRLMGTFAEDTAEHYGFTREAQDAYALGSLERARNAQADGAFEAEICPVTVRERREEYEVLRDEQPGKADPARIPAMRPVFREGGTVTAANSSSISDGAAALVVMGGNEARRRALRPLARVVAHSTHAMEPGWYTTAPVHAITRVLERTGWGVDDVDLYEVNEAFAVVPMVAMRELGIPRERLNVNGGSCSLGHPIGASGARILVTLLAAMERRGLRRGVAAVCIGGGEATAVALEREV